MRVGINFAEGQYVLFAGSPPKLILNSAVGFPPSHGTKSPRTFSTAHTDANLVISRYCVINRKHPTAEFRITHMIIFFPVTV
jgi:hypothetical protein